MSDEIQVGDVCLDLTQGRPVHVIEDTGLTADEWSIRNDYTLCENYGNGRLGATPDDRVYEVVYCSNAKSEPSTTYGMPESRLLRVETEAADDGRPVAERAHRDVLERLFVAAIDGGAEDALANLADAAGLDESVVDEAHELADVERTIGGEDDE